MSAELTRLFLPPNTGVGLPLLMQGVCTAWDPVTSRSTVVVGGVATYTNAPILNSAAATMTPGPVLVIFSAGGPIILGGLTVPV
jgi:hypothetical protein